MEYSEYLKTEHWKKTRQGAVSRAKYRCQLCGQKGKLNVHHNNYDNLGEEETSDLIVLCEKCHAKHHDAVGIADDREVSFHENEPVKETTMDMYLIFYVLACIEFYATVRERLPSDDFEDNEARRIWCVIEACYKESKFTLANILDGIGSGDLQKFVLRRMSDDEFFINTRRGVLSMIIQIRQRTLAKKRNAIDIELKALPSNSNIHQKITDLFLRKMSIDDEINALQEEVNSTFFSSLITGS